MIYANKPTYINKADTEVCCGILIWIVCAHTCTRIQSCPYTHGHVDELVWSRCQRQINT